MDIFIKGILDMINLMELDKYTMLIKQFIKVTLKMGISKEEDI